MKNKFKVNLYYILNIIYDVIKLLVESFKYTIIYSITKKC